MTRCILVADDDNDAQRAFYLTMKSSGYTIIQALTGAEAERIASEQRPDLIILDLGLPDTDGRAVLARLKNAQETSDIPVLVWSGGDPETHRKLALRLGAEDYVEKTEAGTLRRKIERVFLRLQTMQAEGKPLAEA